MKLKTRTDYRRRRHLRVRRKIDGTTERPRMSVFISNKHIYVQFIDDTEEKTLASASTAAGAKKSASKADVETAKKLGAEAAKAIMAKGVKEVVFDRGGFPYHGRVKAIADGAREAGLTL